MPTLKIKEQFNFRTDLFRFIFDKGDLRKISFSGKEIIQRIYYAVRDEEWLSIPYSIENFEEKISDFEFNCTYNLVFRNAQVHFTVKFRVKVENNFLTVETHGKSLSNFKKNRIGLCVHLPSSLKGSTCKITHTNHKFTQAELPVFISPHQPFKDIFAIELKLEELSTTISFEGDVFEMEDQRNWTDASYKIYSTPLELPFPVEVRKGNIFYQKITVSTDKPKDTALKNETKAADNKHLPCPDFGIYNINNAPENSNQLFSYVRIDFRLYEKSWEKDVSSMVEKATNLQLPVYCMLYFGRELCAGLTD